MSSSVNWNYPSSIQLGAGRIVELAQACIDLHLSAPLLVTDPGLAVLPMIDDAITACREVGLRIELFSNIKPNPTGKNVGNGVNAFNKGKHDGVIAFGGGSALDAGKAIALMVGQKRPIWDFEDVGDNWKRVDEEGVVPIIAVPTTAGTGSEVGRASLILDEEQHIKKIIFHPKMLPQIVILDPKLTIGLPNHLTAATGMDALSHNLEAFCSPFYHPMAKGIACEGISLISRNLRIAVKEPDNIQARSNMLVGSTMGATAFQAGLGGMHALAHPLGALYDAHHGLLNAILMPYVLLSNSQIINEKISNLARYIGINNPSFNTFFDWILELRSDIGIPNDLRAINIPDDLVELIGKMAIEDPSSITNPCQFSAEEYSALCLRAINGQMD